VSAQLKFPVYEVRFVIRVDHPEVRGPTYPAVPEGHRIPSVWQYTTQADAVRVFTGMLEGREDYGSEFVCSAEVVALRETASPRTVRRRVERTRPPPTHEERAEELVRAAIADQETDLACALRDGLTEYAADCRARVARLRAGEEIDKVLR
jgi:hypothetical protein